MIVIEFLCNFMWGVFLVNENFDIGFLGCVDKVDEFIDMLLGKFFFLLLVNDKKLVLMLFLG